MVHTCLREHTSTMWLVECILHGRRVGLLRSWSASSRLSRLMGACAEWMLVWVGWSRGGANWAWHYMFAWHATGIHFNLSVVDRRFLADLNVRNSLLYFGLGIFAVISIEFDTQLQLKLGRKRFL